MASFASRRLAVEERLSLRQRVAAAKEPCVSSALQALQMATSSVARAVWCGSGVMVDGKTEWSSAEVADGLVCFAAFGC